MGKKGLWKNTPLSDEEIKQIFFYFLIERTFMSRLTIDKNSSNTQFLLKASEHFICNSQQKLVVFLKLSAKIVTKSN